jgi:hypothetical protein
MFLTACVIWGGWMVVAEENVQGLCDVLSAFCNYLPCVSAGNNFGVF